jgi:predicted nucleic acid-binding protein
VGDLTKLITGKLVAFDTAPLIYYIEENQEYLQLADELFSAIDGGIVQSITSVLTLQEVLVAPLRDGRPDLADKYREVLTRSANVTLHVIDESICEIAAQMRASHTWLRTPDALQIATALRHGAQIMVTNDVRWDRLTEIEVVVLRSLIQP